MGWKQFLVEVCSIQLLSWEKRKSKNIFMSFRYNKFKIMASLSPPFSVCYQIIPPVPI